MAYSSSKHHVSLDGEGYVINQRGGKRYYQKKRSPTFVNKFGGGDSSYRDASFWQYFVQTNWRNGAKQLKFDDAGKFWKSADVDTTILEQLTLSKELTSAGQLAADTQVNCIESWRADASSSQFGAGGVGALTISSDTTEAPTDSAATATIGTTSITATNASFASSQKILIIQMRGTGAGNNEERTIGSYTAGTITTTEPLTYGYTSGAQVRVIPEYTDVTIASTKTYSSKAWNGTVGGILAFKCNGTLTIAGTMSANYVGFSGGGVVSGGLGEGCQGEGTGGPAGTSGNTAANGNGGGGGDGGGGQAYGAAGGGGGYGAAGSAGQANDGGTRSGGAGGEAKGLANMVAKFFGGGGGGGAGNGNDQVGANGGIGGGLLYFYAKTLINTGAIQANGQGGGSGSHNTTGGGGGGSGGGIFMNVQSATLGSGTIVANGGAGGTANECRDGGNGAVGRIHINYANSYSGTTTPTIDATLDSTLADTPASTTSTAYAGASNGKIYSWDNATTWTEVFDARQLTWFDTGTDTEFIVGDDGGTEKACAQGFQIAATTKVKAVSIKLKKNAGTPGNITIRIETNTTDHPSGTLAHANATATLTAFTSDTATWYTVEFSENFSLSATTTYWIVLKTAAASNDNNYKWYGKTASGYSSGTNATSADGGSTWTAGTSDAYFKVLGNTTSINCALVSKVGGTKRLYFGTGSPTGTENGDAHLIAFDGTNWTLHKTFASATESIVNSMAEYSGDTKVYIGIGPQGRVYSTSDFSTFTISKDIDIPQNPGYPYTIKEYNSYLFVGGGSPELVPTQYYNGFLNYYDQTTWRILYPFDFTVIKSMEFYDAYLFMGTYHGQLYVYDTSTLNPLFNFKDQYEYQQTIQCMKYFDDKLYIGLYPQSGTSDANAGVWVFERHGLYNAHTVSGVTGYRCFAVVNGTLLIGTGDNGYVYKLSTTVYKTQGWYQSSYFDANLPSINKLYQSVTVKHDALATGQSVVVYYKYAESSAWTTLGTSNTAGSIEKTLSFPTATYSKKITLKVELNTTTTTASPKLTEVIMQYTLYPERKWMWTMRLLAETDCILLDKSKDTRSAATIRTALETLMADESLYTYIDIDGTSYTVLVNEIDQTSWVIQQDDANEDEIAITLIEA